MNVTSVSGFIPVEMPSDEGRRTILAGFDIVDDQIGITMEDEKVARALIEHAVKDQLVGFAFSYAAVAQKKDHPIS